jgi:hypothetical protein
MKTLQKKTVRQLRIQIVNKQSLKQQKKNN